MITTAELMSGELNVIFLPSGTLGSIIENRAMSIGVTGKGKRTRAISVRQLARVLHDMGIVNTQFAIIGCAWGANTLGEAGLFVVLKSTQVRASGPSGGAQ